MATEKPRFTITLDNSLFDQVHEFKKQNHISTQSKAIQRLIEIGIDEIISTSNNTPSSANAFLSDCDRKLLTLCHELNPEGQEKLLDYADDLVKSEKYIKSHSPAMGDKP